MINFKNKAIILQCGRCKDIIQSQYRHDYVRCECGEIFVDGGDEYSRYSLGEGTVVLKEYGVQLEDSDGLR